MLKNRLYQLSLPLSLGFLVACQAPIPQNKGLLPQLAPPLPQLQVLEKTKQSAQKKTGTFIFVFDLGPSFRTLAVDPSEVKYLKLTLIGDGINETLINDTFNGDGFIPVINGQATATISNIPLQNGKIRIVTAQGYDANKQPLESFVSKGYYISSENQSLVSVDLSRSRLLTGLALEKMLAKDPAKAASLNLQALQDSVNQALGFNPVTGKFLTDPTLFDADKLANMLLNGGVPSSDTLIQEAKVIPGNISFKFKTPRGGAFGEDVNLYVSDPLSTQVNITQGTISPALSNMSIAPGNWSVNVKRGNGEVLFNTSINVTGRQDLYEFTIPGLAEIPIISNVSTLSAGIGSTITLSGSGFDAVPSNNTVKFGTTTATVTASSINSLTVTVPEVPIGPINLTVTVAGQVSNIQAFQIRPGLTAISPSANTLGSSVTLTGIGFDPTFANNTVKFGSTNATVTAGNATSLTVTVPAALSGTQAVSVTTNTLISDSLNFEVKPEITSLSSTSGMMGDSITVNGTGFSTTAANHTVKFGSTNATVTAATATSLTVTVPNALAGAQNVTVQVGNQVSNASAFTMRPSITSLSAANGGAGSSLTLTGAGFDSTAVNNTVKFGSTNATVTAATATSLTVTVAAGLFGVHNVSVTVAGQTNTGTHNFAFTPAINSLSASNGVTGDSLTITGTGFDTTPANNTVKFGATTATVTAASNTSLTVTVPNALAGAQNVSVQVGTQTSATSAFTLQPKITALTTAAGQVAGKAALIRGETLTLSGTGFDLVSAANNTVKFGASNVNASGFSGGDLLVTVPAALGTGDISISVVVNSQSSAGVTATLPVVAANLTGGFY